MAAVIEDEDGYRSSEDEDYAPSDTEEADKKRGKKRNAWGGAGVARRPFAAASAAGRKKRPRLGAAVLSDSDDEPPPPLELPAESESESDAEGGGGKPVDLAAADDMWAEMNGLTPVASSSSSSSSAAATASAPAPAGAPAPAPGQPAAQEEAPKTVADDLWAELQAEAAAPAPKRDAQDLEQAAREPSKWWEKGAENGAKVAGGERVVVRRVKEFAGEKIEVTEEVERGSAEERRLRAARALASGTSNLKGLLSEFGKSNKLSTIAKSRLDWEKSKHDEGDAEELERFRKGGGSFVDRQAFLASVDQRRFEIERAERNRVREAQKRKAASKSRLG